LSYSSTNSTSFILLTNLSKSCLNSLIINTTSIFRFITLGQQVFRVGIINILGIVNIVNIINVTDITIDIADITIDIIDIRNIADIID
jgi:hypothetical protein